mmetsp:Transcript_6532/g.6090  ORF Transcript_6532/g.6090 Transcript_6532/m.6090 type:complete len:110 (+) Transcript_6532:582-911(+)
MDKTTSKMSTIVTNEESANKAENKEAKASKKKLTEFGYLLQRKGFRLMRKYYKEKFEDFAKSFNYKKRVKKMSPNELNHIMSEYAQKEFSSILPVINAEEFENLVAVLK